MYLRLEEKIEIKWERHRQKKYERVIDTEWRLRRTRQEKKKQ